MKYRCFLFLLFFVTLAALAHGDIRMTGPVVTPTATPDPGKADVVDVYEIVNGRLQRTSTRKASYDLLVEAKTETFGKGWVGVRAEGSLDTGLQLNPAVVVEEVKFLLWEELEETEVYARANFITDTTGTRTLTGKGIAAVSAGGNALSFSSGGWGVGVGEGRIAVGDTVITQTITFTISRGRLVPGGSTDGGCQNNPARNWCTDTGTCSDGGTSTTAGACGHRWCLCTIGSGSGDTGSNNQGGGSQNTGSGSGNTDSSSSSSGCANNPGPNWCTDTGHCTTTSGNGIPGTCGHNFCQCAHYDNTGNNNGNSGNTDPSPSLPVTYEACGVHTTGTPGSHNLVGCPPNASGQPCTSVTHYVCLPHGHTYAAPPNPSPPSSSSSSDSGSGSGSDSGSSSGSDSSSGSGSGSSSGSGSGSGSTTPTPTPTPTPSPSPPATPEPETVSCARCSETVPTANAHRANCPNGSHQYWTCTGNTVQYHTYSHTCKKCGSTFSGCSRNGCPEGGRHQRNDR